MVHKGPKTMLYENAIWLKGSGHSAKNGIKGTAFLLLLLVTLEACQTRPHASRVAAMNRLPTNPVRISAPATETSKDLGVKKGDPRYKPLRETNNRVITVPTGSLFHPEQHEGLFLRKRRYLIGDMVQVILEERTSSSKNLDLQQDKSSELKVKPLTLKAGPLNVNQGDINIKHDQTSAFNSSSESRQSNSLDGVINVFVKDILSNGNLVVAGEKWLRLNEGDEYIRMEGEIRRDDINNSNQISSLLVGNALIEYSGVGILADNQEPSVFDKMLSLFN